MPTVLCCMCSLPIPPNPTSMCVLCIRTQVDITEGIATNLTMHQCRGCKRYLRPGWVECKLESRELMAVCLRKVRASTTVVGLLLFACAAWLLWAEPSSGSTNGPGRPADIFECWSLSAWSRSALVPAPATAYAVRTYVVGATRQEKQQTTKHSSDNYQRALPLGASSPV